MQAREVYFFKLMSKSIDGLYGLVGGRTTGTIGERFSEHPWIEFSILLLLLIVIVLVLFRMRSPGTLHQAEDLSKEPQFVTTYFYSSAVTNTEDLP